MCLHGDGHSSHKSQINLEFELIFINGICLENDKKSSMYYTFVYLQCFFVAKKTSTYLTFRFDEISYINWNSYILFLKSILSLTTFLVYVCVFCSFAWYRWASSRLSCLWTVKTSCCSSFSGFYTPQHVLPNVIFLVIWFNLHNTAPALKEPFSPLMR